MDIHFTPEPIRTAMNLWRESIDLRLSMKDDFKLHFILERRGLLVNFVHTANAWQMMLRCMSGGDLQTRMEQQSLMTEVEDFHLWARDELGKLDSMAGE